MIFFIYSYIYVFLAISVHFGVGTTIRTHREIQCLPYAVFISTITVDTHTATVFSYFSVFFAFLKPDNEYLANFLNTRTFIVCAHANTNLSIMGVKNPTI